MSDIDALDLVLDSDSPYWMFVPDRRAWDAWKEVMRNDSEIEYEVTECREM